MTKFKILSAESLSEPFDYHLIARPASNDLLRLSELLKGEIMNSFAVIVKDDSEEMYKQYRIDKNIFGGTLEVRLIILKEADVLQIKTNK